MQGPLNFRAALEYRLSLYVKKEMIRHGLLPRLRKSAAGRKARVELSDGHYLNEHSGKQAILHCPSRQDSYLEERVASADLYHLPPKAAANAEKTLYHTLSKLVHEREPVDVLNIRLLPLAWADKAALKAVFSWLNNPRTAHAAILFST